MTDEPVGERTQVAGSASPTPPKPEPTSALISPRVEAGSINDLAPERAPAHYPTLADGVEFVGSMSGSGFAESQWLIARDGQFLQVSELLYRVAEHADGTKSLDDIAVAVTDTMPYAVNAEHIRRILDTKLAPLGLVASAQAGSEQQQRRHGAGPLRVSGRIVTAGPRTIDPVTGVLQGLFRPWTAVPLLGLILAAHIWLYLGRGLGDALVQLIEQPLLVVPLFGVIVLAGIVHEFGHAAALRYGGGRSRTMGFGFYLIYPALYTDTSDAYRLGRWARIRVDLGGFYFHQIFGLALLALAVLTGQPLWLLAAVVIDLEMLRQLLFPFVRFDGYWLLADLTGIPDLYTHFGAVISRRLGQAPGDVPALRPWPRRVFRVYAAVAIPVLTGLLLLFVVRAPTFIGIIWRSWQRQADVAAMAVMDGNPVGVVLPVVQMVLLVLPLAGGLYLIFNLGRMLVRFRGSVRTARSLSGTTSQPRPQPSR